MSRATQLDPFQQDAIHRIRDEHRAGRRTLLCLPTGTGKTRVAVNYAYSDFVKRRRPVLWVAHTEELLQQAYDTFKSVGAKPEDMARRFGRLDELKYFDGSPLVSFVSNAGQQGPPEASLIIVDEAHHAASKSYTGWLSLYRAFARDGARVLGLTATPYRLEEGQVEHLTNFGFSKPRVPIFESVAFEKSFCELVDIGRIAPFVREQIETHMRVYPKVRNGEISSETLEELNTPNRNRTIVDAWRTQRNRWGKTIIFAGTQEHAKALARAFGPDANYLTSENAERREHVLSSFRRGDVPVLVNVRMLGEGIDVPDVQTVIIARPTISPMLYLQMVGRGARITATKRFFYLVDVHDQLGAFEHFLAGVEDLAERKPGLLEANARRARAALALAAEDSAPALSTQRNGEDSDVERSALRDDRSHSEVSASSSPPSLSDYVHYLRRLHDLAKEGAGFDELASSKRPAGWWSFITSATGHGNTLIVPEGDRAAIERRIGVVQHERALGSPVTSIWVEPLRETPEEVYRQFVEALLKENVAPEFLNPATNPMFLAAVDFALNARNEVVERSALSVNGFALDQWLRAAKLKKSSEGDCVIFPDGERAVPLQLLRDAQASLNSARQADPLAHPDVHLATVMARRREDPVVLDALASALRALAAGESFLPSSTELTGEHIESLLAHLPSESRVGPRAELQNAFAGRSRPLQ